MCYGVFVFQRITAEIVPFAFAGGLFLAVGDGASSTSLSSRLANVAETRIDLEGVRR